MNFKIIDVISSRNVPCWGNTGDYIGIHYLGVVGQAHDIAADGCGAHFYIYWDGTIYQRCSLDAVPWAVGTAGCYTQKHPVARNSNTISIEMCCKCDGNAASAEDKKWYFTKETQEACAWLVAKLQRERGIPDANVLRHYDIVNKICPAPYVHNNKYRTSWTWTEFKSRVKEYRNGTVDKPEIKPGIKLKTLQRIPLRSAVSTAQKKAGYVKYSKLKSAAAKKKCRRTLKGNATMRKGRRITVQEVKTSNGNIWVRIKIAGAWLPVVVGGVYRVAKT